jgi:hypothetical protein
MTMRCFRGSRPDSWTLPKPNSDPSSRMMKFGPILPMEDERSLLSRLLSR